MERRHDFSVRLTRWRVKIASNIRTVHVPDWLSAGPLPSAKAVVLDNKFVDPSF